jgi:hypothetical protein
VAATPDESPNGFDVDVESAEHLRFLGAVITIVADGEDTRGALTVTQTDAPLATRTTSTRTHLTNCSGYWTERRRCT